MTSYCSIRVPLLVLACLTTDLLDVEPGFAGNGQVDLVITDQETGKPMGARLLVRDPRGRIRRFPNSVWQGDYTYAFYEANLKLPEGPYFFEIDAGPEYRIFTGNFEILSGTVGKQEIQLQRMVNLPEEHWWVTELSVSGRREELEVMLDAAGVDIAGWSAPSRGRQSRRVPTFHAPTSPRSRWVSSQQGEGPLGSRFYLVGSDEPEFSEDDDDSEESGATLDHQVLLDEFRSRSDQLLIADSALGVELPLWIGLGLVDGVAVLPWFLGESAETLPSKGYDLDRRLARRPVELGQLNEQRYYELLNCGLKLPACSGSQWSDLKQPLATNRMMIAAADDDSDRLAGLRVGKTWVSNGPLLRVTANGELPGHLFAANAGGSVSLNLALRVSTRYKLKDVEVIKDGEVLHQVELQELARAGGKIPPIEFSESGWVVVRTVAEDQDVYRVALTSPFYVDINQTPRISRQAVALQLERLEQMLTHEQAAKYPDALIDEARKFWNSRLEMATAP